jgi:DNA-binding transcriptional MerR regulator
MRQLDLFNSLFETFTGEKPEEKEPVVTKEEKPSQGKEPYTEPYSMVGLAVEMLSNEEVDQQNYSNDKKEYENIFVFDDHLRPSADVIPREEIRKVEEKFLPELPNVEASDSKIKQATPNKETAKKARLVAERHVQVTPSPKDDSIIFSDGKITVKLKSKPNVVPIAKEPAKEKEKERVVKILQKRGRKSFKEIDSEVDLVEIPEDEVLFQKQYYPISEVAKWFRVNTSLLRFWENEFDILKPRKNRKGDRLFRPEDVKNLQLIYHLLRQRKYTIEGAKEYIKTNRRKADIQLQLTHTLQKFKSFLLDLKANLQP